MARKQPALIALPVSTRAGEALASLAKGSVEHSQFFADGFVARWNTPNDIDRRNAVRQALIAKYNLA